MEQRMMFSATPLAAPTLTATPYSPWQVDLSWKGVSGATNYLVDFSVPGMTTQVAEVSSSTTTYSITGLKANTSYSFGVGAWNNSAGGTWSNWVKASTYSMSPVLTAASSSASGMKLSWSCASTPSNFVIDEGEPNDWTRVKSVSSATTTYSATWTDTNDTHQFRVGAVNASGIAWSNYLVNVGGTVIDHPELSGDDHHDPIYANATGTLFGTSGQPSFTDVRQGDLGDCWLLASLAEVAYRDPQAIVQMFTPDGTALEYGVEANLYKVRLYDSKGVAHSVVVDTELPVNTDANSPAYADRVENGVLWVALAEKAYAQANGAGFVTTEHVGMDRYGALNGGDPAWALEAITGNPPPTPSTLTPSNIVSDWTKGQLVVLSTSDAARNTDIVGDAQGTHAYALIGCPAAYTASNAPAASPVANYNANATTASLPFELYNPWGTDASGMAPAPDTYQGHAPYGLFTANWACISQNFSHYSQGTPEAVPAETGGDQTKTQRAAQTATDLVLATWGI
jgi:hypothetical protein